MNRGERLLALCLFEMTAAGVCYLCTCLFVGFGWFPAWVAPYQYLLALLLCQVGLVPIFRWTRHR